jgi:hypothetical protein
LAFGLATMLKKPSTLAKNPLFLLCAGALCGGLIVFAVSHARVVNTGAASAGEQRQNGEHAAAVAATFSGEPQQNIPPPLHVTVPLATAFPGREIETGQTTSGYPIVVGRRAVDSGDETQTSSLETSGAAPGMVMQAYQAPVAVPAQTVTVYQSGAPDYGDNDPYRRLDRRGLIGNPPVDPISSHGAAYSRSY